MRFRTEFEPRHICDLDPRKKCVLLGSCFSDNIGGRMRKSLWPALVNPCGTLFNPFSISNAIFNALGLRSPAPLFCNNDVWMSWDFPSAFSGVDKEQSQLKIDESLKLLRETLYEADSLIITFGTSIVYSLVADQSLVVANCHKLPASTFIRKMLSVDEIVARWNQTISSLREINPDLKLIFTVSPVRHLKEGFTQNSISKATLLLAVSRLCESNDLCYYFPAFEIVNDDLRDYRFFASDLVHPSEEAIEYIWEKFCRSFLSCEDMELLRKAASLRQRIEHRPLIAGTKAEKEFKDKTELLIREFQKAYPSMLNPKCL